MGEEERSNRQFRFCIYRGGTFTDIYAEVPGEPGWRTVKLLSVDPSNYDDACREAIRRVLEEVTGEKISRRTHRNLTMLAGVKLEVMVPSSETPDQGQIEGSSAKELSTTMLVLGIWAQKGSAGQKVLENFGFNEDKIAELAATMKKPARVRGMYEE